MGLKDGSKGGSLLKDYSAQTETEQLRLCQAWIQSGRAAFDGISSAESVSAIFIIYNDVLLKIFIVKITKKKNVSFLRVNM